MFPKIVKSRSQVRMSLRDYPESDQECIYLPLETYPELFACKFPAIILKSEYKEWRLTKKGNSKFLLFKGDILSDEEREFINEWRERFSQYVLLGLNRHISGTFTTELDFCLALDYNFDTKNPERRTLYGEAEYQLKYRNNRDALDILASGLTTAMKELCLTFHIAQPVISIAPSPEDKCSVPRKIAKVVSKETSFAFVDCTLHCDKTSLKQLPFQDKITEWNRLYSQPDCVKWTNNVTNQIVFLIDDLYQSGTTLWTCAKELKARGAKAVIGVVCVKSFKDTDNQ